MNLEDQLKYFFGYSTFQGRQKEVISSVLSGCDTLAVLPTGAGKSLCYLLPSQITPGLTVVISPLVSLMEDQVMQLKAAGFKRTAHLSGMLDYKRKQELISQVDQLDVLFLSPEMLQQRNLQAKLLSTEISLFAVDEAHCISQWGHEFRTDYLRIGEFIKRLNNPVILALTATAPERVREDIIEQMGMNEPRRIISSVDRENIYLEEIEVETDDDKRENLLTLLKDTTEPAIIYCGTRNDAEQISTLLKRNHFLAEAYHGGMVKEDRLLIQQQFYYDQIRMVCATNAFGMGINKANIRHVIHYHIPSSIEQYIQEIGRAGRDGNQSTAHIIWKKEDLQLPLWMVESEFPNHAELEAIGKYIHENKGEILDLTKFYISEKQAEMIRFHLINALIIDEYSMIIFENKNELASSFNNMRNHFNHRSAEKRVQAASMGRLLLDESCIRERILVYFQEDELKTPEVCCNRCGKLPAGIVRSVPAEIKSGLMFENWESVLMRKFFGQEVLNEETN
ncbi:RecQ family ATP-dependent DNA helicase [Salisediminibacterium beveridgei]|uniref:RecQ family ATP-dependent DNA helicase n=1 Tax=Salisediminibacterium beveridgei TaxID=632773 RepID=UPI0008482D4D|nr:ATP-dependent DNA helicase RecQ [Salisediminibacterium beveridgei]